MQILCLVLRRFFQAIDGGRARTFKALKDSQDHLGPVRQSLHILLRGGIFAQLLPMDDVQPQQPLQKLRARRFRHAGKVLLDPRPRTVSPGRCKATANLLDLTRIIESHSFFRRRIHVSRAPAASVGTARSTRPGQEDDRKC